MLSSTFIDEFGFDRIERTECPQAAHLLYKIIASRNQKRSTALVANVDSTNGQSISPMAHWRWLSLIAWSRERSSSRSKASLIVRLRRKPRMTPPPKSSQRPPSRLSAPVGGQSVTAALA